MTQCATLILYLRIFAELHTPPAVQRPRRAPARRDIRALHVRRPGRDRRPTLEGIRRRRTSHRRRGSRLGLGTGLRINPHRGGHDRAGGTYGLECHQGRQWGGDGREA